MLQQSEIRCAHLALKNWQTRLTVQLRNWRTGQDGRDPGGLHMLVESLLTKLNPLDRELLESPSSGVGLGSLTPEELRMLESALDRNTSMLSGVLTEPSSATSEMRRSGMTTRGPAMTALAKVRGYR